MRKRFRSARKFFTLISETMFRKAPWAAWARGGRREGKGDMKAAAEEKARLEREANPTTEDLLKQIRDLLKRD